MSVAVVVETPLPRAPMVVVLFVQLSEAFHMTVLLPFVAFMVADFEGIPEEMVGLYSGLVAASFALGQVGSSFVWGRLADRVGARPCVLFSVGATAACMFAFGFSQSVPMAVALRIATGVFNGNLSVVKSYLGRVTDSSNSAHAMALLSGAWAIGSILAPMIGGFLSEPADKYPDAFPRDGLFGQFPYLLPCLFAGAVSVCGFVVIWFIMKEADEVIADMAAKHVPVAEEDGALPREAWHKRARGSLASLASLLSHTHLAARPAERYSQVGNDEAHGEGEHARLAEDEEEALEAGAVEDSFINDVSTTTLNDADDRTPSTSPSSPPTPSVRQRAPFPMLGSSGILIKSSSSQIGLDPPPESYVPHSMRLVWYCTMMYGLIALFYIWIDEIFPLYCRESVDNQGLGFTSSEIGIALGVLGGVSIVYNLAFFKAISKRVGLMRLFRISVLLSVPMCIIYPITHYVYTGLGGTMLWVVLIANVCLRGIIGLNSFTPVMVFVNNSVPREKLGLANGIGQTWASSVRAFGPAMGGLMWSFTGSAQFPFHSFIVWLFVAVLGAVIFALSFFYPNSIERQFVKVPLPPGECSRGDNAGAIELGKMGDSHDEDVVALTAAGALGSDDDDDGRLDADDLDDQPVLRFGR
eukprot:Unigene10346_Nuclearia_a/m.31603 Unigene10346_Nuclearia_a/g.31603  ORF Unigene10346_Nuclearia_a/g.31603 Unigene10346_Nuclearia_a/m.31603 type:complete len:640 (+) Unigene10346_Nuclearia_a:51-1970(+)